MSNIYTLNIGGEAVSYTSEIKEHLDFMGEKIGETKHLRVSFANGYVVSVVKAVSGEDRTRVGGYYCTVGTDSHEVAILLDDEVVYDIDIELSDGGSTEGDVCGYIDREDVNRILRGVQRV